MGLLHQGGFGFVKPFWVQPYNGPRAMNTVLKISLLSCVQLGSVQGTMCAIWGETGKNKASPSVSLVRPQAPPAACPALPGARGIPG